MQINHNNPAGTLPKLFDKHCVQIIGLGYVGLTLAVALADRGYTVHGVEIDQNILNALNQKRAHFSENGLNAVLAKAIDDGTFSFSDKLLSPSDLTVTHIVTIGTPLDKAKKVQFDNLKKVVENIASNLNDGDSVFLRSTVGVGTTRSTVLPILEKTSKNFYLAFCPERTLEGRALEELRSLPQVVGGLNSESTHMASQFFSQITPSIVRVTSLEAAELVKLVNNTERDMKFSFANEIATMCDTVGLSAAEIIKSANFNYPRSSLAIPGPVGGPCLEKDPLILAQSLGEYGYTPGLTTAARDWNENLPFRCTNDVANHFNSYSGREVKKILILGLAFKGFPETDDLRGSLAIPLAESLRAKFPRAELYGFDSVVSIDEVSKLKLNAAKNFDEAFDDADIVIVQNNHVSLRNLDLDYFSKSMNSKGIIYDLWSMHFDRTTMLQNDVVYMSLGGGGLPDDFKNMAVEKYAQGNVA